MTDDGFDAETEQRDDFLGLSAVARRHPTLRWSDRRGPQVRVIEGRTTVGSAERAELRVEDRTVSRLHAELALRDDGLWIRDLGSKNGTFISSILVTEGRVPDNVSLQLGAVVFTVQYEHTPTPVPLWQGTTFGPLVGGSVAMRELYMRLTKFAPLSEPVLIHGETGVGKELVAQAIHDASPRADKPFLVVDCTTLTESLGDAELFGHVQGAYTGADQDRMGSVEAAHGGTLFLDEIGDLPLALQPKLLRLVETKTYRRVGESAYRSADVRFVAATHRNLGQMVNEGSFREDLFFRLATLPVHVPPLRARCEDVPMLLERFLPAASRGLIHPELLRRLMERPWPGNVRELRSFAGRVGAFGPDAAVRMLDGDAPVPGDGSPTLAEARQRAVADFERRYLAGLLAKHHGVVADAAEEAGVARTHLHSLVRKYGL